MTPRGQRILEKQRQQREAILKREQQEIAKAYRPWYPPPRPRDYMRNEDLKPINPGESHD